MGRAPCCEKVGLNKGLWSAEEDEILRKYIEANGEGSWRSLPKNAGLKRCGKSCRLRWVNYLRGDIMRGNITSEEEDIIIKMHSKIGSRWSVIAEHLPGRTDNEIKNYWKTYLSRRIYTIRRPLCGSSLPATAIDIVKMDVGCRGKGRTSNRAARKKNNPQEIPSNAKEPTETLKDDKESQNVYHHGEKELRTISSENAGKILNSSEDIMGPYQSCIFADDDIMSDELLSPIDILSLNEKYNEIITLSEGQGESTGAGGISLSSNGAAAAAAESTDEWYVPSCNSTTSWDNRQGVVDEGRNHRLLADEGDELLSLLWDTINDTAGNDVCC